MKRKRNLLITELPDTVFLVVFAGTLRFIQVL